MNTSTSSLIDKKTEQNQSHSKPTVFDVFKDLDQKILTLDKTQINELISTVEMIIQNNHKRALGFEAMNRCNSLDVPTITKSIEKENHYLSGEVLPQLMSCV